MAAKKNTFHFEKSLAELEKLVSVMEQGDISLEDSLKHFEKGIQLTQACQKALDQAEQKVQILLQESQSEKLQDFTPED